MAFLLEKFGLMLFGVEVWLRIGCGWLRLIELIHIIADIVGNPVVIGVHRDFDTAVVRGYGDFLQPGDDTCYFWSDQNIYKTHVDYNVIYQTKTGAFPPSGTHELFEDPHFVNDDLENFDGHLQPASPAIDNGLSVGSLNGLVPNQDLTGSSRPQGNGVDRGAYEFPSAPTATMPWIPLLLLDD